MDKKLVSMKNKKITHFYTKKFVIIKKHRTFTAELVKLQIQVQLKP